MYKLIRWYNQNRLAFWIGFIIIALIIIVIQTLNNIVREQNAQKKNNINSLSLNNSTNAGTSISEPDTSVITGKELTETESKNNTEIIKAFVDYCNNGEIENAYNMLTDECKSLIYPTIESFNTNYYAKIFYMSRMYELENWYISDNYDTYYIKYTENVLATGNINSEDNKADYITVVKKDDGYKLNVSNYIKRIEKNKSKTSNDISITVNWIDMYMDYTILNISVKNNTKNTIVLDTTKEAGTTYLYDTKNINYTSLLNENAQEELTVKSGMTNTLNIKFNKIYNTNRELDGVTFSDINLNYESLDANDKITIKVEL